VVRGRRVVRAIVIGLRGDARAQCVPIDEDGTDVDTAPVRWVDVDGPVSIAIAQAFARGIAPEIELQP
jgi:hypothetical protein